MTALKAHEVDRYLKAPDAKSVVHLVYGSDQGLVREVTQRLVEAFAGTHTGTHAGAHADTMSKTTLDAGELSDDPGRLSVEARTPSLFGGQRVIRVRNGTKALKPVVQDLIDNPPDAQIIIEAGSLPKSDALRTFVEKASNAKALPCFADSGRALDELMKSTFDANGIAVDPDVIPGLRDLLGNDREVTRRELEKLVLFALEDKKLCLEDALILCGDNAALQLDKVVDAVGTGHARQFDTAFQSALASGIDVQRLLTMALYHFSGLRRMRLQVSQGKTARSVIESSRPRPHFSRVPTLEQQLRLWTDRNLRDACDRLQAAILETRQRSNLARTITQRTLLALCVAAARR